MGTVIAREERRWQTRDGTNLRHPDKSEQQPSPKGGSRALDIMKTFILKNIFLFCEALSNRTDIKEPLRIQSQEIRW